MSVITQIPANDVGLYISTNLTTPAYKEVVCAEDHNLEGSADVNKRKTKTCGTLVSIGAREFTLTGSGVANATPTTNPIATFGAITGGSLYTNGTYTDVPLTGGTGTGATANITVAGAAVTVVTLVLPGYGYTVADALSALAANIGGTGSGFEIPVATLGTLAEVSVDEIFTIFQDATPVLFKLVHRTTPGLYYRQGRALFSAYSEALPEGEDVGYDYTLEVTGSGIDISS